jgi:hypothetical protein
MPFLESTRAGVFCLPESFMRAALRRTVFMENAKEFRAIFLSFSRKIRHSEFIYSCYDFLRMLYTGITKSREKRENGHDGLSTKGRYGLRLILALAQEERRKAALDS